MKILFTGGGSGGHFYPIIAVAEKLNEKFAAEKLPLPELFFMSTDPYNEELLRANHITFKRVVAGKMRGYFSILNFFDLFKTAWGVVLALFQMFSLYPDVVFGKGGYASFPVLVAAWFYRIPVIIHESDSVPGRVNAWAGKFAEKIAVSYPEAAEFFPAGRTALTGNPIREDILRPTGKNAYQVLGLDPLVPVLLILGGSQGARMINDQMVSLSPRLVEKYQVIHQTGVANLEEVKTTVAGLLGKNPNASRYHIYGYLDNETMKLAAEATTVVVSRAGSTIFEIAHWGLASIIIPIANHVGDHQRKNAFAYARAGAATVIEEANLAPSIVLAEIDRLMANDVKRAVMRDSALAFSRTDAAVRIAEQITAVVVRHSIEH